MNDHGRVAFLLNTRARIKCLKPKEKFSEPTTLGQHLRARRLSLGLIQREVADQLSVNEYTIQNWESGKRKPMAQHLPAILRFLGYDPYPSEPKTIGDQLAAKCREFGWTQKETALHLGVDPSMVTRWEAGRAVKYRKHREALARFLYPPEGDIV
jgi:transcriptional regulator with XRE-family HTH domain